MHAILIQSISITRSLNNDNVSEQAKHEAEVKLHGLGKLKEDDQGHEGHGHA